MYENELVLIPLDNKIRIEFLILAMIYTRKYTLFPIDIVTVHINFNEQVSKFCNFNLWIPVAKNDRSLSRIFFICKYRFSSPVVLWTIALLLFFMNYKTVKVCKFKSISYFSEGSLPWILKSKTVFFSLFVYWSLLFLEIILGMI